MRRTCTRFWRRAGALEVMVLLLCGEVSARLRLLSLFSVDVTGGSDASASVAYCGMTQEVQT